MLSGSWGGTALVWNIVTGEVNQRLTHTNSVEGVAFSPNGAVMATAYADGSIRCWLSGLDGPWRVYTGHAGKARRVRFSPDGQRLISCGDDGFVRVWPLFTSWGIRYLRGLHLPEFGSPDLSSDGRLALAVAPLENALRVWDLETCRVLGSARVAGRTLNARVAAFGPGGETILVAGPEGGVGVWDATLQRKTDQHMLPDPAARIASLAVAPRTHRLLAGLSDGDHAVLWDLRSGVRERLPLPRTSNVHVALAGDASLAAAVEVTGAAERWVVIWNTASKTILHTFKARGVGSLAFSPDGRWLACAGEDLRLIDTASGTESHRIAPKFNQQLWSAAFTRDGKYVLCGGEDREVNFFHVASGQRSGRYQAPGHLTRGFVWGLTLSHDGKDLLPAQTLGVADELAVLDLRSPATHQRLKERVADALKTIKSRPEEPRALETLGEWYAAHGMWRDAVVLLESARSKSADVAPLLLGECYWKCGQVDQAREEFSRALKQATDAGRREEARHLERWIRAPVRERTLVDIGEADLYLNRANFHLARDEDAEARKWIDLARSAQPMSDSYDLAQAARVYLRRGRLREGLAIVDEQIGILQQRAKAQAVIDSALLWELATTHLLAASFQEESGDLPSAVSHWRRAADSLQEVGRRTPHDLNVVRELAAVWLNIAADPGVARDFGEVRACHRRALEGLERLAVANPLDDRCRNELAHFQDRVYRAESTLSLTNSFWIWYPESGPSSPPHAPAGTRYFRHSFEVPGLRGLEGQRQARVWMAGDDQFVLHVNGKRVRLSEPWQSLLQSCESIDISTYLKSGTNVLAVEATNRQGLAGVIAMLRIESDDAQATVITSDRHWRVSNKHEKDWASPNFDDSMWLSTREVAPFDQSPPAWRSK
jgi:WD40 repeat protein